MTKLQKQLTTNFPHLDLKFDYPLAKQTYFKIGGPAEAFVQTKTKQELINLLTFANTENIKYTILGGASNVIVDDNGISGLVIQPTHSDFEVTDQKVDTRTIIRVESGLKTSLLVSQTVENGFKGLEYFLGVPGTVGGAVYNNAHYLEDLIGEHIYRVEIINSDNQVIWLSQEECQFGYDSSRFQKSKETILSVEFALDHGNKEESKELIRKATQYRAKTQPLGIPSSGCIFQNVPNTDQLRQQFPQFIDREFVPGGFLIDQAGLKGEKSGDIEVSHKHAAFMINHGHGTAQDLKKLISHVKTTVKEKFGVELQEEVFFLE